MVSGFSQYSQPRDRGARIPMPYGAGRPSETCEIGRWVQAGEVVEICGRRIDCGLFYQVKKEAGGIMKPAPHLIVQNYAVSSPRRLDPSFSKAGQYWPTYESLGAEGRGRLLDWMAAGLVGEAPRVDVGFVYFYGLEYRLLTTNKYDQETDVILARIKRLASKSTSDSFVKYAANITEYVTIRRDLQNKTGIRNWVADFEEFIRSGQGLAPMALSLRIAAYQMAGQQAPFDETMMMAMAQAPRTVKKYQSLGERLPAYISEWRSEFKLRFPQGYPLRIIGTESTPLQLSYRRSSSNPYIETKFIPDARLLDPIQFNWTGALNILRDVDDRLGPALRTARKIAVIKKEKIDPQVKARMARILQVNSWAQGIMAGRAFCVVDIENAAKSLGGKNTFSTLAWRELISDLKAGGVGVEPSWDSPKGIKKIGLMKEPSSVITDWSCPALTVVSVFSPVQDISQSSLDKLLSHLIGSYGLQADAERHLRARAEALRGTLVGSPGKWAARILENIPSAETSERVGLVADMLLEVGSIAGGIAMVEALYDLAKIPRTDLYARQMAGEGSRPQNGSKVDMDRIKAIAAETQIVNATLSAVFSEDEGGDLAPSASTTPAQAPVLRKYDFPGLDARYHALWADLQSKESWTAGAFDALAKSYNLMPAAAIDVINEWGIDTVGDDLIILTIDGLTVSVPTL